MTDVQRTDLDSARAVQKVFGDNQAFVDGDADLKTTQIWLSATIADIDEKAAIQMAGRGGAKDIKDNLKETGTEIGQKWLKALKGLAASTDNSDLARAVEISPSDYEKLPDNEWYQFNLNLIPLAQGKAAAVAKFGRTDAELTTLEAVNESFRVAMPTPEAAIQEIAKVTSTLAELFQALNSRLREKTDALVKAYEDVQPGFVADYLRARKKS